jgi:integrase
MWKGAFIMSIHPRKGKTGVSYQVKWRRENGTQGSQTFRTRREATVFDAQVILDDGDARGITTEQRKVTFAAVAELWTQLKDFSHSTSTKRRRDQILRLHVLPELGHIPIRLIKTSHLRTLVASWQRKGLAPYTIRNHIANIRPIFKLAMNDGLIAKNPCQGLELDRPSGRNPVVLDTEQCRVLLGAVSDHYRRMFYTLLATGLRIGELFKLRVGDVDFRARTLIVRESKTTKGVREIDLSENDLRVLKEQISSLKDSGGPESLLFQSPNGKALHYRNVAERVLKKIIKDTGLPRFTFHDLRCTHATMLVAAGIDPKVVQQRMGHESIETTLKYYAQPTKERQIAAAHVAVSFLFDDPSSTRPQVQAGI